MFIFFGIVFIILSLVFSILGANMDTLEVITWGWIALVGSLVCFGVDNILDTINKDK
jgi:quinol-cytochrome oxidoreductase complex cytochrome b subunit